MAGQLQTLAVQIAKSILSAELLNLNVRFVIARQHPHAVGMRLQNRPSFFQPAAPIRQIARGDVVIGLLRHQLFQRAPVLVDIGKDQQFHVITGR